ncbi:hypothetical protein LINGRAHAP2_LOCUS24450 [Linum grandiflorum]
MKSRLW